MTTQFIDLREDEILSVNGGGPITLGAAIWTVTKIVGGAAVVGFIGGAVYELIFGE